MPSSNGILLQTALLSSSQLQVKLQKGMGAFSDADKKLVAQDERSRVGDSLDLDAASKQEFPSHNRWDYVLSVPDADLLIAIEPHSARDSEVSVVIKKKNHALTYLRSHFHQHRRVAKWLWVSRRGPGFSKTERARRQLDSAGIEYVSRVIHKLG